MKNLSKRILKGLEYIYKSLILKIKSFRISDNIVIFSDARGGSTWLMEMLNKLPKTCINWEPLHVDWGVIPRSYNWGWLPSLSDEDDSGKHFKILKNVFELKAHSKWTLSLVSPKELISGKYVITKFVRANLLISYILKHFDGPFYIYLSRHPIDVCQSQLNAWAGNDSSIVRSRLPGWLNDSRYINHMNYLKNLESPLELQIANWCINNKEPIERLESFENLNVLFYSDILQNPREVLSLLFRKMGVPESTLNNILDNINYRRKSMTDFKNKFDSDPVVQLTKNFDKMDISMKNKIQRIFDYFEIRLYSAYSPYALYTPKNALRPQSAV